MITVALRTTLNRAVEVIRFDFVVLALFATTLFCSALLLFSVQPIFAKIVLPELGGSPSVWAVSLCFFQATLLAGYCYAHIINRFFAGGPAAFVHLPLLCLAFLALPFGLPPGSNPPTGGAYFWLIGVLALGVGLPFFAISATAPLLQAWFGQTGHPHAKDPYFLYGASNLGSLMALIGYPILLEPFIGLEEQAHHWCLSFVGLTAMIALCAVITYGTVCRNERSAFSSFRLPTNDSTTLQQKLSWVALSFIPSGLLVAFTTHLSTDIASAPLLWVIPLAVYLGTFILVFREKSLIPPKWLLAAHPILVSGTLIGLGINGWILSATAGFGAFFATTMLCHRQLFNLRPKNCHLTEFYMWMSLGGVLGGIFAALISPLLFNSVYEYPLLLVLGMLCRPGILKPLHEISRNEKAIVGYVLALGMGVMILPIGLNTAISDRSFFGVHRVKLVDDGSMRLLLHGTTVHGAQRFKDDAGKPIATPIPATYYSPGSPMAEGVQVARQVSGKLNGGLDVGIVGLGTGAMSCYSLSNEQWRFYEIDPIVVKIARKPELFSFLSQCQPQADIVIGDARKTLGNESKGKFDYLIIDAFSSDSVPVHLLTQEAIALYLSKLAPDGILALHISNRHMDLISVAAATALAIPGTHAAFARHSPKHSSFDRMPSRVMFVTKTPQALAPFLEWPETKEMTGGDVAPWTDDYSNIVTAIWRAYSREPSSMKDKPPK